MSMTKTNLEAQDIWSPLAYLVRLDKGSSGMKFVQLQVDIVLQEHNSHSPVSLLWNIPASHRPATDFSFTHFLALENYLPPTYTVDVMFLSCLCVFLSVCSSYNF